MASNVSKMLCSNVQSVFDLGFTRMLGPGVGPGCSDEVLMNSKKQTRSKQELAMNFSTGGQANGRVGDDCSGDDTTTDETCRALDGRPGHVMYVSQPPPTGTKVAFAS